MKTEITFTRDHRGSFYYANTDICRIEYFPESNGVLAINDYGEHVGYKLTEGILQYQDSTNGDFLENEEDLLEEVENKLRELKQCDIHC